MACSRLAEVSVPENSKLPHSLQNFYSHFGDSPWAPVAVLAMHLAKEVVPFGCLFNVRMAALLSIASQVKFLC